MSTRFSCTGCGSCCTDHHVPLTLTEAKQWAADGGTVIILTEAFLANGYGVPEAQLTHATRRSTIVDSGSTKAHVAITFAAYNVGRCRNLDEENLCRIYERRPLVCRIYPMEINPHIPLRPENKDCPPESWEQGPDLIVGTTLVDTQLLRLIEQSRQADRDEIDAKQSICQTLGIRTTALKGNGFVAYLPDMNAFAAAIEQIADGQRESSQDAGWEFHVVGETVIDTLQLAGAKVTLREPVSYLFIPLQAA
ncbi:YkgJ family cysteine cluster protein [Pseudomonas sp. CDFA 602]|uniref:YkgJ family cysteine cluster protein n=1 Tax=Pseudomonas californiensis TaxID=2829823 RepID=UPI001E388C4F|nr:YkgJ family cysteine cluster protein [Pseudomonas californiensis]MCD5993926.1 YkgJ family cysteine cluster protein [Pseudomonas californiensis]MCD5999571.1 YkgJ family cysteine cluster protein [Pseudomonas californiensis]